VSLGARIVGMIRRPRTTLRDVISAPRWFSLLVLITVAPAAAGGVAFATGVGRQALVDQWERTAIAFGQPVDDARYAEFQAWSAWGPAYAAAGAVAGGPLLALAAAVVLFWARGAARHVTFAQTWAVSVHAGVILALARLIAAPLVWLRETSANTMSLASWVSGLDESSPAARLLGAIDVFVVWWAIVLSIGAALLFGWRARRCAAGLLGVYAVLALAGAAIMALAGRAV